MKLPQVRISAYNKHANGVVERGHFTLREAIIKTCKGKISDWPNYVPDAVFADRVTINRSTGFSPFQLLHATDPVLPFDLTEATFLVEGFRAGISTSELLSLRIRQLHKHEEDIARAAETLRKSRFKSKAQFEKRFHRKLQKDLYKPGELVLIRNTAVEVQMNRKDKPRYLGPYQVVRKNKGGAYILAEVDGAVLHERVAAFRLIPYITRHHEFMKSGWMADSDSDDDKMATSESSSSSGLDSESSGTETE